MNGGAWLLVEGLAVDVLLRDIKFVEHIGKEVSAGRFSSNYQIGHPHGWHSYMVLSEVHYNRPVAGDLARLDALHKCTVPYPIRLRSAIVHRFLFEAKFTLKLLRKLEGRDELTHCAGLSYRCVMSLVHVLFALNETWVVNEKGAVDETSRFRDAPTDFAARAHAVSEPSAVSRLARNAALASLFEDVGELARRLGFDPTWDDASFPRD
jgi:hypothetical protein